MNATPLPYVGADMAKNKFDVALLLDDSVQRATFQNTHRGHAAFLAWLEEHRALQSHICLEATGRYSQALALFLHQHQMVVSVVNPLAVYYFARSQMSRTKTDEHDALLLARFGKEKKPRRWQPRSEPVQALAQWVRLREQLINNQGIAQRQQQDAPKTQARFFEAQVRFLKKQIRRVEKKIQAILAQEGSLREASRLLESIPGLGPTSIATILALMPPVEELASARQLAAYAGVTPRQNQSGTHRGPTRLCKLGHGRLRRALYLPAIVAMRHNPRARALAQRLALKGKSKMSIIGACMRQLLHLIYGVLKHRRPFEENYLAMPAAQ